MKRVNIGLASMVVIVVSITMMSLSILSYLSAKQSLEITQRNIEVIDDYYHLSNEAYRYLETLDQEATFTIEGKEQSLTVEVTVTDGIKQITKWQLTNNDAWHDQSKYPIFQEEKP